MKFEIEVVSIEGSNRAQVLRALRTVGKMSLPRAQRVYEFTQGRVRTTLVAGIEQSVAEHIASTLAGAGIVVEIKESDSGIPMVCEPQAGKRYRWGAMRMLMASGQ